MTAMSLEKALRARRDEGRKVLAPYITGGFPGWQDAVYTRGFGFAHKPVQAHPQYRIGVAKDDDRG